MGGPIAASLVGTRLAKLTKHQIQNHAVTAACCWPAASRVSCSLAAVELCCPSCMQKLPSTVSVKLRAEVGPIPFCCCLDLLLLLLLLLPLGSLAEASPLQLWCGCGNSSGSRATRQARCQESGPAGVRAYLLHKLLV